MNNELQSLVGEGYALMDAFTSVNLNYFFDSHTATRAVDRINDLISKYNIWRHSAKKILNNHSEINKAKIHFLYETQRLPVPFRPNLVSPVTAEKQLDFMSASYNLRRRVEELAKLMLEMDGECSDDQRQDNIAQKVGSTLITQDTRGNFFYDGNPIELAEETLSYKILDIIYSKANNAGFISYDDIEKEIVKRGGVSVEPKTRRNRRIQNAITNEGQGLFRYAMVGGKKLTNKTLRSGEKLIEVVRGKGLRFNNPTLP